MFACDVLTKFIRPVLSLRPIKPKSASETVEYFFTRFCGSPVGYLQVNEPVQDSGWAPLCLCVLQCLCAYGTLSPGPLTPAEAQGGACHVN